jgi:hypothetical protein
MVMVQGLVHRNHPSRRDPLQRYGTIYSSVARKCSHCLALLFIVGIFSLSSIRERDMDLHHLNRDISMNGTHEVKMNNGWIPNEDIEKYSSLREKKESLQNINPEEELRKDYSYKPSLSTYPLSLLKNLTEPLEETDVIFQFHIPKAGTYMMIWFKQILKG